MKTQKQKLTKEEKLKIIHLIMDVFGVISSILVVATFLFPLLSLYFFIPHGLTCIMFSKILFTLLFLTIVTSLIHNAALTFKI